ncbi:FMN-dependent NADH-azoreductase [Salinimonas lutimaris]|uniref:FMN-dependent NADH-azoreductase n=1 Tax=Salinimonas lutimaris TaxID=914153 RepID=UPI0010C11CC2|nr:NAD(P)H-dependent oxidoreductase [Salinimonas lutimaris]
MSTVLVINTSLNHAEGNSSKLTQKYVDTLAKQPDVQIVERNLAEDALPHLSGVEMGAWMTPAEERTEEQKALAALSDNLVEEFQQADEVVIGVPMYNFGIPSVLKAWIDRVARAGITFRYTENGPVGLVEGKRVTVLAARGGQYQGSEFDTQTPYLTHFFGFIGITDVRFVYAEGLAMGSEVADSAFSSANEKIIELIG